MNDRETQIYLVARFLMDEYGLDKWNLRLRIMRRSLGRCKPYIQTIVISKYFINTRSYDRLLNTVLHEIAHALTPRHHHDLVWKAKARELGAIPRANMDDAMFLAEKAKRS